MLFLCYVLLTVLNLVLAQEVPVIVKTPTGDIQGYYKKSFENRTFLAFEGIPYAKPPVGDLRFMEPQPAEKWEGILVANRTYSCFTYLPIPLVVEQESEDCLYMYVYLPKDSINVDDNFDVVVHIHGGSFSFGSPAVMAGPEYIVDRDVIFVAFNYRLTILGFLNTEDDVVSGNNGLKDQAKALLWVKENIKYFGGNPNSVTLTGVSSGGSCVHYHFLSPLSKGLFHRAISQSGTAIAPWAVTPNPLEEAKKIAKELKCPTESTTLMVECFRKINPLELVGAVKVLKVFMNAVPVVVMGPSVEKGTNPFLSDHPFKLLRDGEVYDVPWIDSNVKDEGIIIVGFMQSLHKLPEIASRWEELIPYILEYHKNIRDIAVGNDISKKIKQYYFKNESVDENTIPQFIKLINDRLFLVDAEKAIKLQAKATKSPVYYYMFSYSTKQRSILAFNLNGSAHGDDSRLFLKVITEDFMKDPEDIEMINLFTKMIAHYAKTGKPQIGDLEWKHINPDKGEIDFLEISSPGNIVMKKTKHLGEKDFWDSLSIQENDKLF